MGLMSKMRARRVRRQLSKSLPHQAGHRGMDMTQSMPHQRTTLYNELGTRNKIPPSGPIAAIAEQINRIKDRIMGDPITVNAEQLHLEERPHLESVNRITLVRKDSMAAVKSMIHRIVRL